MNKKELGSATAKGGFANEKAICKKLNNWKNDDEATLWLSIMGYNLKKIDFVQAIDIPVRIKKADFAKYGITEDEYEETTRFKKADVQVQIRIMVYADKIMRVENLSLKKANSNANYNQIDKRAVDFYKKMWIFDEEISLWLKLFSGEILPIESPESKKVKYRKNNRIFFDEMPKIVIEKVINFFDKNRILVVSDIIKGRGGLAADWMLVTMYNKDEDKTSWILKDINTVMNFFGKGEVKVSKKGSLYIGKITMQRKGGTPDPTKLQFKINPCRLFEIEG